MMKARSHGNSNQLSIEERRIRLDEGRLTLDNSFAKKWVPTLVTLMAGLIAGIFGSVQQQSAVQATERVRIQARAMDELQWGVKVVEMYFNKRELFDLTTNYEQAEFNLRVLAAVAPKAVQGVLDAERIRIPPPGKVNDQERLASLAAVAGVQDALRGASQSPEVPDASFKASDFTIYLQYPAGGRDDVLKARTRLVDLGYRVPGIEQVGKAPSRLEVRYYRTDQRSHAEELVAKLGGILNLPAGPDNAVPVKSSKPLPSGILEVWLPSRQN